MSTSHPLVGAATEEAKQATLPPSAPYKKIEKSNQTGKIHENEEAKRTNGR